MIAKSDAERQRAFLERQRQLGFVTVTGKVKSEEAPLLRSTFSVLRRFPELSFDEALEMARRKEHGE